MPTSQFLVFAAKSVLLFAGLIKLVADTLNLSLLVAKIPLALFVQLHSFFQARLNLDVDAFELLSPLLELASCSVSLLQVDDEYFDLS